MEIARSLHIDSTVTGVGDYSVSVWMEWVRSAWCASVNAGEVRHDRGGGICARNLANTPAPDAAVPSPVAPPRTYRRANRTIHARDYPPPELSCNRNIPVPYCLNKIILQFSPAESVFQRNIYNFHVSTVCIRIRYYFSQK